MQTASENEQSAGHKRVVLPNRQSSHPLSHTYVNSIYVAAVAICCGLFGGYTLLLGVLYTMKPGSLTIPSFLKLVVDLALLVSSLYVETYFNDRDLLRSILCLSFHLIPLSQLCKPIQNVGLVDALISLGLQVSTEISIAHPEQARKMVVGLSVSLQILKYLMSGTTAGATQLEVLPLQEPRSYFVLSLFASN